MVVTIASVLTLHTPPLQPTCQPLLVALPPESPQTLAPSHLCLRQRPGVATSPTVCAGLLAPFLLQHPTSVPNMEAKGPFDNGSWVLSLGSHPLKT